MPTTEVGAVDHSLSIAIEHFVTSGDEYYAYYAPDDYISFNAAEANLRAYVEIEGPFDGVIAFSQGTSLVSALLLSEESTVAPPFRCAILICGRLPMTYESSCTRSMGAEEERLKNGNITNDGKTQRIGIPTVHIRASNDPIDPNHAEALWVQCTPHMRWGCVHELGHEVPGARDKEVLVDSVTAIRRMLGAL